MHHSEKKYIHIRAHVLLLMTLGTALLSALLVYFGFNQGEIRNSANGIFSTQTLDIVEEESQTIEVVQKASPAVVSIVASAEVPLYSNVYDDFFPEGFRDLFGLPPRSQDDQQTQLQRVGAGTGFIVSSDGYIVTNRHVVNQEDAQYTVILNNGQNIDEEIEAKVLARDPDNDLAILKIERTDLPYLEFDDSEKLQVGQTAITIGYALGEFDNTVSKGVISGLARSIIASGGFGVPSERLRDLIQTDAAINPGNSGGPMLNIAGRVIGINVAVSSGENIGFAIPGNIAKSAFEEVQQTGTIEEDKHAYLGVRYLPINSQIQVQNNLPYDYGALVLRGQNSGDLAVIPGSPADNAGIEENDIILELDGKKLTQKNQLADLLSEYKPGETVRLKVFHNGNEEEIEVNLEEK